MTTSPPPWLTAVVDQATAAARDVRGDAPHARFEGRCVAPPTGCGQPLPGSPATAFRDQPSRDEYRITGLCQSCQDRIFVVSPEELAEMAADTQNYGRCGSCGEYREYERVDVGVGVDMIGFDCCPPASRSRCDKTVGCWLSAGHAYGCDAETDGPRRDRR
jgi:hypothetical protein